MVERQGISERSDVRLSGEISLLEHEFEEALLKLPSDYWRSFPYKKHMIVLVATISVLLPIALTFNEGVLWAISVFSLPLLVVAFVVLLMELVLIVSPKGVMIGVLFSGWLLPFCLFWCVFNTLAPLDCLAITGLCWSLVLVCALVVRAERNAYWAWKAYIKGDLLEAANLFAAAGIRKWPTVHREASTVSETAVEICTRAFSFWGLLFTLPIVFLQEKQRYKQLQKRMAKSLCLIYNAAACFYREKAYQQSAALSEMVLALFGCGHILGVEPWEKLTLRKEQKYMLWDKSVIDTVKPERFAALGILSLSNLGAGAAQHAMEAGISVPKRMVKIGIKLAKRIKCWEPALATVLIAKREKVPQQKTASFVQYCLSLHPPKNVADALVLLASS